MKEWMPETQGFVDKGKAVNSSGCTSGSVKLHTRDGTVLLRDAYTQEQTEDIIRQGRKSPRKLTDQEVDLALANDIASREHLQIMEAWAKAGFTS